MNAPAFTTRADAEAPPAQLVEIMGRAAYEATRTPSFPIWGEVTAGYRNDMAKAIRAAIAAAEEAGWRMEKR